MLFFSFFCDWYCDPPIGISIRMLIRHRVRVYLTGSEVKQADAILVGFPLGLPMSPEVRRNDLECYEAVTDPHGPAMTWVRMSWFQVLND